MSQEDRIRELINQYNQIKYKFMVYAQGPDEVRYYQDKLDQLHDLIRKAQREIVSQEGSKRSW